jgi:hypothetical protein
MEIIQFFFCNFWHFIGLVIVLGLVGEFILKLVAILRGYAISEPDIVDDSGKVDFVDIVDRDGE